MSISELMIPDGWHVEWFIQHDGDSEPIEKKWFRNANVHYEHNGRHLGAAGTRNQALLRTSSEFVLSYDPDDLFKPQMLVTLSQGFENEDVVWSAGSWYELHEDESVTEWRHPMYEGVRDVGWIYDEIMRMDKTPFSMNPTLYKRSAVVQAGGWPGFPEWEDTILLTIISGRHKGWATDKLVGLYRRHPDSISSSQRFQDSKPTMYTYIKEVGKLQK